MPLEKIKAPFSKEQAEALNNYQRKSFFHPFTCCGFNGCDRSEGDGILIANKKGWTCPCGKYKQKWAYKMMLDVEINKR